MTRKKVYKLIDEERDYQQQKWNEQVSTSKGQHATWEEWLIYMEDYLAEAKRSLARTPQPLCNFRAACSVRKVAALAVAGMEQLGAPSRKEEGSRPMGARY